MDSQPPIEEGPCEIALPAAMPVMVLTDCALMPGCFLPLYIFEERYRLMLAHALRTCRMFCIGAPLCAQNPGELHPATSAGLIRACVQLGDGTSQLLLYGVQRIRITGWEQLQPFRIATIEPIHTSVINPARITLLRQETIRLLPPPQEDACDTARMIQAAIKGMTNAERLCDIIAYHFIKRPAALRALLSETSLERRYELVIAELASRQH